MSMKLFMAAHEKLIEEHLLKHPEDDWTAAYNKTADKAYDRMRDDLADKIDHYRLLKKEGII